MYIRAIFLIRCPFPDKPGLFISGLVVNFPKFFPKFGASWLDPLRVWYVLPMNMQWKAPWSWCRYPSYWKSAQSRGKSSCSTSFLVSQSKWLKMCVVWSPALWTLRLYMGPRDDQHPETPRIWQATHQLVTSSYYCWSCGSRSCHQLFILCCMSSTNKINKGNVM